MDLSKGKPTQPIVTPPQEPRKRRGLVIIAALAVFALVVGFIAVLSACSKENQAQPAEQGSSEFYLMTEVIYQNADKLTAWRNASASNGRTYDKNKQDGYKVQPSLLSFRPEDRTKLDDDDDYAESNLRNLDDLAAITGAAMNMGSDTPSNFMEEVAKAATVRVSGTLAEYAYDIPNDTRPSLLGSFIDQSSDHSTAGMKKDKKKFTLKNGFRSKAKAAPVTTSKVAPAPAPVQSSAPKPVTPQSQVPAPSASPQPVKPVTPQQGTPAPAPSSAPKANTPTQVPPKANSNSGRSGASSGRGK